MEGPQYIKDQLIQLRQLEQAAILSFNLAKTNLINIKKKIKAIEKLLCSNNN